MTIYKPAQQEGVMMLSSEIFHLYCSVIKNI